jgi:hypothetical protein
MGYTARFPRTSFGGSSVAENNSSETVRLSRCASLKRSVVVVLVVPITQGTQPGGVMTYLRCTIGRWNIDLSSKKDQETFRLIKDEGLRVFRSQPGLIRYRLMFADSTTTIAVAEWESEELVKPGAQRYRQWLRSSGIAEKLSLETYDGPIVDAS